MENRKTFFRFSMYYHYVAKYTSIVSRIFEGRDTLFLDAQVALAYLFFLFRSYHVTAGLQQFCLRDLGTRSLAIA